jgi:uncharacterized membrane protein YfcA
MYATQVITGTVLCATTVSALSGSTAYWLHGATDVKLALTMGIPGAVTAIAGSYLNKRVKGGKRECPVTRSLSPSPLPDDDAMPSCASSFSHRFVGHLTKVIAAALLLIAPGIALRERKSAPRTNENMENVPEGASLSQSQTPPTPAEFFQDNWHLMLAGAGAGFSQGFIGVGGGLLITSLLSLGTTIPQHCIIGSTLGSSAIMNMSATVVHYKLGNVNVRVAALISVAATATAFVASHLALQIEEGSFTTTTPPPASILSLILSCRIALAFWLVTRAPRAHTYTHTSRGATAA